MTAAQALTSGLPSPPANANAQAAGGVRGGPREMSFRDALDSASRSAEPASQGASRRADARGREERAGEAEARNGDVARGGGKGEPGAGGQDVPAGAEKDGASSLSLVLQVLVPQGDAAEEGLPADGQPSGFNGDLLLEQGPWLPSEDGEALDAGRLLALLKSGGSVGSQGVGAEALARDAAPFAVTITGEETHLALGPASAEVAETLAQVREVADAAAPLRGAAKAVPAGPVLPKSAEGVPEQSLAADDPAALMEPAAARRGSLSALQESGQQGAAFADQGIAGREGRQQEGRGGAGSSGQPTGGAFASALQGTGLGAAGTVRDAPGAAGAHEPPSEQIAASVRAELRADGLNGRSSEGVVRVLHLELKPANLGAVTVRLELKDNVITLHLETQRLETLAVIEREREALASALSRAGYSVDGITAAPQSEGARTGSLLPGLGAESGASPQGQAQQGQGLANSSGQGRSGQPSPGNEAYSTPSEGKDDGGSVARRGIDGLYV